MLVNEAWMLLEELLEGGHVSFDDRVGGPLEVALAGVRTQALDLSREVRPRVVAVRLCDEVLGIRERERSALALCASDTSGHFLLDSLDGAVEAVPHERRDLDAEQFGEGTQPVV